MYKTFFLLSRRDDQINTTVCNFQSMKSPVELNSLLSKFFCYITWFVISPYQTRQWTTSIRGLYVKSYCFFEAMAQRVKNCKLFIKNYFSFLHIYLQSTSSPVHLFSIRGKRKRGPGTLQARDQNLPKQRAYF